MTIAVTGVSGSLGGLIAQMLVDKLGADQVILITRRPEALGARLSQCGALVRRADFEVLTGTQYEHDGGVDDEDVRV
jgi:uncharacterized protein YbjT (DUF2867 family)